MRTPDPAFRTPPVRTYRTPTSFPIVRVSLSVPLSRKGDCWDNAVAESFFATLEVELLLEADWLTRDAARQAIFEYIEVWYNRLRRHSSLGYRSPVQYEVEVLTSRVAA